MDIYAGFCHECTTIMFRSYAARSLSTGLLIRVNPVRRSSRLPAAAEQSIIRCSLTELLLSRRLPTDNPPSNMQLRGQIQRLCFKVGEGERWQRRPRWLGQQTWAPPSMLYFVTHWP